jgi:hypothetical protein
MDQRRLRLGDILDDYCPRERRVTNHAIVAMVEDDVKQTRCTTCDAEHVYKGGKAPRRKKGESTGALYKEVIKSMSAPHDEHDDDVEVAPAAIEPDPATVLTEETEQETEAEPAQPDAPPVDEGPVHRPLIRAQLPRPEGVKIERQAPEFTIRQRGNGSFRGGDMRSRGRQQGGGGGGGSNAQRFGRGPHRGGGGNQRFGRGPRNKRSR